MSGNEDISNAKTLAPKQRVSQDNSIDNILTIVNQPDISIENRRVLQAQVRDFEQECMKQKPDDSKLRTILNYIYPISKDTALKLFVNGLDSGILKF